MNESLMAAAIVAARVADVSLGTLKTVAVVRGWRARAAAFGLLEVVIWLSASAAVFANISQSPLLGAAYCIGYVGGTWVGMRIEQWIASGDSVVRVLTRKADAIVPALRHDGSRVSRFDGADRNGPVSLLYIDTKRRLTTGLARDVAQLDPDAFCTTDEVCVVQRNTPLPAPQG